MMSLFVTFEGPEGSGKTTAAKRVVECKKIEIKADEYWHVMKKDGSYTFYMEENTNV